MVETVSRNTGQDWNKNTLLHSQSFRGGKDPFGEQVGLREIEGDLGLRSTSEFTLVIGTKPQSGKRVVVKGRGSP